MSTAEKIAVPAWAKIPWPPFAQPHDYCVGNDIRSRRVVADSVPWFLMKLRGGRTKRSRKPMMTKNWALRVSALRNGRG